MSLLNKVYLLAVLLGTARPVLCGILYLGCALLHSVLGLLCSLLCGVLQALASLLRPAGTLLCDVLWRRQGWVSIAC